MERIRKHYSSIIIQHSQLKILLFFCIALFMPFIIGGQILEWSWSGNSHVGLVIRSSTWILTVTGTINNPILSISIDMAGRWNMWILLLVNLMRLSYVFSVLFYSSNRFSQLATIVTCLLNTLFSLWLSIMYTLSPHIITASDFYHFISAPTSDFTVYFPLFFLVLVGLFMIKTRKKPC